MAADIRPDQQPLLRRVAADYAAAFRVSAEPDGGRLLQLPGSTLQLRLVPQRERHFLMEIVNITLAARLPGSAAPGAVLEIRHRGAWRRTGIACRLSGADSPELRALAQRIGADGELAAALLPVDFRRLRLTAQTPTAQTAPTAPTGKAAGDWQLYLETVGGCEVINRLPSFRRYVRLPTEQVVGIAAALERLLLLLRQA